MTSGLNWDEIPEANREYLRKVTGVHPGMNCLMDNDAILKLAAIRLLADWQKQVFRLAHRIRVASSVWSRRVL